MKCPNCGEEMAEGALYCEHCGRDIHMVSDFEPELEQNIQQIISGIMEELDDTPAKGANSGDSPSAGIALPPDEKEKSGKKQKPGNTYAKWLPPVVAAVIVLCAAVGTGGFVFLHHSLKYQVEKAEQCTEKGDYDRAVRYYNRALELDQDNLELWFSLAEVYFLKNNKIEYEYLLRGSIQNPSATTEQLDRAYGKLIAIYRARKDYQTINELILNSGNDQIISAYRNYIALPPEFSMEEGHYTSIQPLKLTAAGTGSIYYTLDGSEPDENSSLYTMPIILENGNYVVKAIFVNENGIVSETASRNYTVEYEVIPAPEVNLVSGTYSVPQYIEVLNGYDNEVYYTMDGSQPSYSSNVYTGPSPMPLGSSQFLFARIEEGVVGEVTECHYELTLNTELLPNQGVQIVLEHALASGRILDGEGHFDEGSSVYGYEYLYAVHIDGNSDYYVIAEILKDEGGNQIRTGNYYGVDVYSGEYFRLEQDGDMKYTLAPPESQSGEVQQ